MIQVSCGDVDIDVFNRDDVLSLIRHIPAMKLSPKKSKHATGIYIQNIPVDYETGWAYEDYNTEPAQKLDLLNFSVLDKFLSNDQISHLINIDPDWSLLTKKEFVEKTTHIHNWFELISSKKIDSVEKLAMFLGIIRPGKDYLKNQPWSVIEKEVWKEPKDGYFFKKSHAFGYALTIVALMNLESGY